jgi:uncharacterized membrane protein
MSIMKRLRSFVSMAFLGGFIVVLPILIFVWLLEWLLKGVHGMIQPLSGWVSNNTSWSGYLADITVVGVLVCGLFLIGAAVSTRIGAWVHEVIENIFTRIAPGYKTIRDVVSQLMGGGEGNASILKGEVCRAYILGRHSGVSVTGIVTAKHINGDFTVYVPTAPIPTSGFVYHLESDCVVFLTHVSVEEAMRTVIACGSGSALISETPENLTKFSSTSSSPTTP